MERAGGRAWGARADAAGNWASGPGAQRASGGAAGRCRRAAGSGRGAGGARPRCASWLRAMHQVHSAYFRSGLTRYCS